MSNALQTREPSMDEILASIRRIIEGGDERGSLVVHEQVRQVAEAEVSGKDEDLDLKARAFSEGSSERAASHSAWPEGPGEPANDRTAMVAQLKRETKANAPDANGDKPSPSAEPQKSGGENSLSVGIDLAATVHTEASAAVSADGGSVKALQASADGDGLAGVSPSIQQARQSAQSLAARTERLIAVVAGLPTDSEAADGTDGDERNASSLLLPPATGNSGIASTEMSGPRDEGKEAIALQDSLRSLRQDAFGEAAPARMMVRSPEALALDAFAEFDEDEFANELLDRTGTLDAGASSTDADFVDAAATLLDEESHEDDRPANADHAAQDGASAPVTSSSADGYSHPRMDAAIHKLISDEAGQRVSASFTDLAVAIRDEQMQSIDDTVRTMLRPMLQDWLDDNLPHMVERLVREEIERVARGGRR